MDVVRVVHPRARAQDLDPKEEQRARATRDGDAGRSVSERGLEDVDPVRVVPAATAKPVGAAEQPHLVAGSRERACLFPDTGVEGQVGNDCGAHVVAASAQRPASAVDASTGASPATFAGAKAKPKRSGSSPATEAEMRGAFVRLP